MNTIARIVLCLAALAPGAAGQSWASPTSSLSWGGSGSSNAHFESSEEARSAANRAIEKLRDQAQRVEKGRSKIGELTAQKDEAQRELEELLEEKEHALHELKTGQYCSQCGRPKSQIEREESTSFGQHLVDVNGKAIPAGHEQLRKKAAEYDRKIERQRAKVEQLEERLSRKRAEIRKAEDSSREASSRYRHAREAERRLLVQERQSLALRQDAERHEAREHADDARRARQDLERQIEERLWRSGGRATQDELDALDRLDSLERSARQRLAQLSKDHQQEWSAWDLHMGDVRLNRDQQEREHSDLMSSVLGSRYVPSVFTGYGLATTPAPAFAPTVPSGSPSGDWIGRLGDDFESTLGLAADELRATYERGVQSVRKALTDDLQASLDDFTYGLLDSEFDDPVEGLARRLQDRFDDAQQLVDDPFEWALGRTDQLVDDVFEEQVIDRFRDKAWDLYEDGMARWVTGKSLDQLDDADRAFHEVGIGRDFAKYITSWFSGPRNGRGIVESFDRWQNGIYDWILGVAEEE